MARTGPVEAQPAVDSSTRHEAPQVDRPGEPTAEVDATGLTCPMPVIELSSAIEQVPVGGAVRLLATDPTSRVDVPVWCRMRRHRLLALDEDGPLLRFLVERRH